MQFVNYTFIILGDEQWFSDILESPGRWINVHTPGTNLSDVSIPVQQKGLSQVQVEPGPVYGKSAVWGITKHDHG